MPIPFGMWVYNDFVKYEKGFGKWVFNRFAAKPVFISTVNPELRVKVATNLLHDYGYFNGKVSQQTILTLSIRYIMTVSLRKHFVSWNGDADGHY